MRTSLRFASLLLLAGATLAGCDIDQPGRYGNLTFTPTRCGGVGCSFSDELAVGGVTDVQLSTRSGAAATGLHLVSSAPWILDVRPGLFGGELYGVAPGTAQLMAFDDTGDEVDEIDVDVAEIDHLDVDVYGGGVQGPYTAVGADALYRATPGAIISVRTSPYAGIFATMGEVQYQVALSQSVAFAVTSSSDDIARGKLDITMPAGEHDITIVAPGGAAERLHFSVH